MTVVILCGGQGIRYKNVYNDNPKALAPIGNMPILWHLFKYFDQYGLRRFVLCLGAYGDEIRNYVNMINDPNWEIICVDTGLETPTGGRIKLIEPYIEEETFMATYVDGLSDLNIEALKQFHESNGTVATLTAIRPHSQFGILDITEDNKVTSFHEKPPLPFHINGGFFVFKREVFNYLNTDDTLEVETFHKLMADDELSAYKHPGYWKSMDTFKENQELDKAWLSGSAPWKIW